MFLSQVFSTKPPACTDHKRCGIAPFPGTPEFPNGSSRPGRNLYTDSTVALSLKNGKLRWYRQAVAHDIFDQDFVHALIATTDEGAVVVGAGKGGQVLGMDPKTGKLRW